MKKLTKQIRLQKQDSKITMLLSYFCRKDTMKLHLQPFWQLRAQLFREHRSYCISQAMEKLVATSFTFRKVFEAMNLGLFSSKKEQCDLCCAFKDIISGEE